MSEAQASDREIQPLINLISNTLDAYTTALFIQGGEGEALSLVAFQSLSDNIDENVRIASGEGLIGFTHKNGRPVNVDKFDQDTRRLMLYRSDESIKSFMAVPLKRVNGVLAADSKQRYVFTEKSHKILQQFGDLIEMTLERRGQLSTSRKRNRAVTLIHRIDCELNRKGQNEEPDNPVLKAIREFFKADACLLAALGQGQPDRYYIAAESPSLYLKQPPDGFPVQQGLAGWIIQNRKSLVPDRIRIGSGKSFILYPGEPLKKYPGFAGFPMLFGNRIRGSFILCGPQPFDFDQTDLMILEVLINRLAINLEMDVLFHKIKELKRLDPQMGLPHRTDFSYRLAQMVERVGKLGGGLTLYILRMRNLDEFSLTAGQETVFNMIRAASHLLLKLTPENGELGHLDFGIVGIALPGKAGLDFRLDAGMLNSALTGKPLVEDQGGFSLLLNIAEVRFPVDGRNAEELIYKGLSRVRNTSVDY